MMILMKIYLGGDISGVLPSPEIFAAGCRTNYCYIFWYIVILFWYSIGFHDKYMNKSDLQHTRVSFFVSVFIRFIKISQHNFLKTNSQKKKKKNIAMTLKNSFKIQHVWTFTIHVNMSGVRTPRGPSLHSFFWLFKCGLIVVVKSKVMRLRLFDFTLNCTLNTVYTSCVLWGIKMWNHVTCTTNQHRTYAKKWPAFATN